MKKRILAAVIALMGGAPTAGTCTARSTEGLTK